jgi:hypothetical protein
MLGSAAVASTVAAFHRQMEAAVPLGSVERPVPPDPSKAQGIPLEDTSYGSRVPMPNRGGFIPDPRPEQFSAGH